MNRTLVELGRAMINTNDSPEFLWEYSILHAAYLWNRLYETVEDPNPIPGLA
jgi:hypothetical protein